MEARDIIKFVMIMELRVINLATSKYLMLNSTKKYS
jgi:hypothetical protein